jgi:DHA3 family macrolide efflux protein-like MFS transporter
MKTFLTRNAACLWTGRFFSYFADQLLEIAVIGVVWTLTKSSTSTAIVTFMSRAPYWSLVWIGTIASDDWPQQATVITTSVLSGFCCLAVFLLDRTIGLATWELALISFSIAALRTIEAPALNRQLPSLAPAADLQGINAVLDNTKRVARLVGPLLIGWTKSFVPVVGFYLIAALAYWMMALATGGFSLRIAPAARPPRPRASMLGEMRESLAVLDGKPVLRYPIFLSAAYTVAHASCYWVFIPRVLLDGIGSGLGSYSLIVTGFAAGGLVGNLLISSAPIRKKAALAAAGMSLAGLAFFGMGAVTGIRGAFWISILGGVSFPMMDIAIPTLIHEEAPEAQWGKLFALWRNVAELGIGAGLLAGGPLCDRFGPRLGLYAMGSFAVLVGGLAHLLVSEATEPERLDASAAMAQREMAANF